MNLPDLSDVPLLAASGLCASRGEVRVSEASLAFDPGAICAFSGGEGSGHHLLLRLLGLMERPDSGVLCLQGAPTGDWSETKRAEARNLHYGYLFASPFLLPAFNVVENVAMPYFKLRQAAPEEARGPTKEVLDLTGLTALAEASIEELSPALQHRVALARALVCAPGIVVIEKVDSLLQNADLIAFMELLGQVRDRLGPLILLSTDTPALAGFADRIVELRGGRIVDDRTPKRFFP